MPLKVTYLFDYVSAPANGADAASHKGGWSETIWQNGESPIASQLREIANHRRLLLPSSVRIIGYRQQVYQIVQSGLLAGGASIVLLGLSGNQTYFPDLPQVALSMVANSNTATNSRRFSLRGIPDSVMVNGEYQPSASYRGFVTAYGNALIANGAVFPGRDLTQPIHNIESILDGKLRTIGDISVAVGDRVLLRRCKDVDGVPVIGIFTVTAVVGRDVTLGGFDLETVVGPVGLATRHVMRMTNINNVVVGRAVVRKIGRPFEQYRGRRSKRR